MISAKALAASTLYSSEDRKRQATTARRLIGGLRAAATSSQSDLTEGEKSTLSRAITLLSSLSDTYAKAAVLRKADEARQIERSAQARKAIRATFGALFEIADKVAVVAAATPYLLNTDLEEKLRGPRAVWHADYFLHQMFEDALNSIAQSASWRAGEVEVIAADAWTRFEGAAKNLRLKHARVIQLIADAQRAPASQANEATHGAPRVE